MPSFCIEFPAAALKFSAVFLPPNRAVIDAHWSSHCHYIYCSVVNPRGRHLSSKCHRLSALPSPGGKKVMIVVSKIIYICPTIIPPQ